MLGSSDGVHFLLTPSRDYACAVCLACFTRYAWTRRMRYRSISLSTVFRGKEAGRARDSGALLGLGRDSRAQPANGGPPNVR